MKTKLKPALAALSPARFAAVREAYFKAAEGLRTLAAELEHADADLLARSGSELLNEHLLIAEALEIFDRSQLGRHV